MQALALKVLMGFLHKKTTAYNTANNENTFPFSHFSALVGLWRKTLCLLHTIPHFMLTT